MGAWCRSSPYSAKRGSRLAPRLASFSAARNRHEAPRRQRHHRPCRQRHARSSPCCAGQRPGAVALAARTYAFDPGCRPPNSRTVRKLCQRMTVPQGDMRLRVRATVETESRARRRASAPTRRWRFCPTMPCSTAAEPLSALDTLSRAPGRTGGDGRAGYAQVGAIAPGYRPICAYRYGSSKSRPTPPTRLRRRRRLPRLRPRRICLTRALRIGADGRRLPATLEPMACTPGIEAFVGGRWYTFDATQQQRAAAGSCSPTVAVRRMSPSSRNYAAAGDDSDARVGRGSAAGRGDAPPPPLLAS
jgi:hypothetical protein